MSLILTVTRQCNLRCSYCPTAKDGWPSLSEQQAIQALDLYASRGGGEVKIFGGEPLLAPEVTRAVFEHARSLPQLRRVSVSTNGLNLDRDWLSLIASDKRFVLTLSVDGAPGDHSRFRRPLPGVADSHARIMALLPDILRTPRVIVTQVIPPASADRAEQNFRYLLDLGFTRFNLLPGYYLPWRPQQLEHLRQGFGAISALIRERWRGDRWLYLRNLFTWAPTPFFNTGMVVDADGSIAPSNLGLSGKLDHLREQITVGTLDKPPSPEQLDAQAARVQQLLQRELPEGVWDSTLAVDAALSEFVRGLYPAYRAWKKRRGAA